MRDGEPRSIPFFYRGHGAAGTPGTHHDRRQPIILVDPCTALPGADPAVVLPAEAQPVKPPVRERSPAEQLADQIVGVIETHAHSRNGGRHNVREVVDAFAIAQGRLLAFFAQHQPGRADLLGALLQRIGEECRNAGDPDVSGPGGPVH